MSTSISTIIDHLNKVDVKYVVVGGVAVNLHGHPRMTLDLDLVLAFEHTNLLAATGVLTALNFRPRVPVDPAELANPESRRVWTQDKGMIVLSLINDDRPPMVIDLFVHHPFPFEEMLAKSEIRLLGLVPVRVCSIEHLVTMKRRAGRKKDLDDIQALEDAFGDA